MQTRTLLTALATAAVAAIAVPSVSHAQTTPPKTTPQVSKGDVAMSPSFGSLMKAINATSAHTDSLKALTNVSAANVQLVNVDDLLKGNDVQALNNALKTNESAISTLRSTLGADSTISNVITTGGSANAATSTSTTSTTSTTSANTALTTNDIIAADVTPDGKVVLYYWKKAS